MHNSPPVLMHGNNNVPAYYDLQLKNEQGDTLEDQDVTLGELASERTHYKMTIVYYRPRSRKIMYLVASFCPSDFLYGGRP